MLLRPAEKLRRSHSDLPLHFCWTLTPATPLPQADSMLPRARAVPSGTILLKDIATLATHDSQLGELQNAAIYIKGNEIAWVGLMHDMPADMQTADQTLELSDHVRTLCSGLARATTPRPLAAVNLLALVTVLCPVRLGALCHNFA